MSIDKRTFDFSDNKMSSSRLLETKNFNFSADAFPITKAHGLITPKNWASSFEKLPNELNKELSDLYTEISKKVKNNIGGNIGFFEHGESGSTINGGSCNNHAHLHLVNSGKKIKNYTEELLEKMNKILLDDKGIKIDDKDIFEIKGIIKNSDYLKNLQDIIKGGSYYQIGDGEKAFIIKNGEDYHKSQIIREAGAKLLEGDNAFYDWKNTDDITKFLKTGEENNLIKGLKGRINTLENSFKI